MLKAFREYRARYRIHPMPQEMINQIERAEHLRKLGVKRVIHCFATPQPEPKEPTIVHSYWTSNCETLMPEEYPPSQSETCLSAHVKNLVAKMRETQSVPNIHFSPYFAMKSVRSTTGGSVATVVPPLPYARLLPMPPQHENSAAATEANGDGSSETQTTWSWDYVMNERIDNWEKDVVESKCYWGAQRFADHRALPKRKSKRAVLRAKLLELRKRNMVPLWRRVVNNVRDALTAATLTFSGASSSAETKRHLCVRVGRLADFPKTQSWAEEKKFLRLLFRGPSDEFYEFVRNLHQRARRTARGAVPGAPRCAEPWTMSRPMQLPVPEFNDLLHLRKLTLRLEHHKKSRPRPYYEVLSARAREDTMCLTAVPEDVECRIMLVD